MSKLLQLRGGTTSQHSSFTGAVREVTVDTDKDTLVVHDGSTAGGFALPRTNAEIKTAVEAGTDIALGGNPTTTTQSVANNSTRIATTAYADAAAAAVVDSAPGTLNTLNELAAALGDDANYATTTTNAIATKLPLAGGTMTGDLNFSDNVDANFGASADLKIYHDGSHGRIINTTGNLNIRGNLIDWRNQADDESLMRATNGGSVDLYHNNVKKFETTSAGATVTGNLAVTGTVDGVDIQTLNTTASAALPKAGGTMTGGINGTTCSFSGMSTLEGGVGCNGQAVFNEDSQDLDFRVESNGNTHMLFVDGGADHVNIGTSSDLGGTLNVNGIIYGPTDVGLNSGDKISWTDNTAAHFHVNANEEMRLEADGDLHVDGDVIAYSTTISDERLKDNIEVVEDALDKVKQLRGVTFNRKQDNQASAGVIAQEVEKVLPQAVKEKALPLQTGNDGLFKTVQYDALHALLIESIKELSARVEELENK